MAKPPRCRLDGDPYINHLLVIVPSTLNPLYMFKVCFEAVCLHKPYRPPVVPSEKVGLGWVDLEGPKTF